VDRTTLLEIPGLVRWLPSEKVASCKALALHLGRAACLVLVVVVTMTKKKNLPQSDLSFFALIEKFF
jgi:hypothetical protein